MGRDEEGHAREGAFAGRGLTPVPLPLVVPLSHRPLAWPVIALTSSPVIALTLPRLPGSLTCSTPQVSSSLLSRNSYPVIALTLPQPPGSHTRGRRGRRG